jgi:hypothetical protein
MAQAGAGDQPGEVFRGFKYRGKPFRQGDFIEFERGEEPPLARQAVVFEVHGWLVAGRGLGRP